MMQNLDWGNLQIEHPSYEAKLKFAKMITQKAISKFGDGCAVSFSGGKDSTLVLWLALKIKPDIKVVFENTLNEFPETISFIRGLTKEWNLNLIETKPSDNMTFRKCLDKYGLPKARQTSNQGKQRTPKCCLYLKEKPALKAIRDHGITCMLTGITSAESENRFMLAQRYEGCGHEKDGLVYTSFYYYAESWKVWKFNPIMNWTEKEVFEATDKLKIPLCEVYTKWNGIYNRLGCLMCTAYNSWEQKLPKSHPLVYLWLKSYEKNKYASLHSKELTK